MVDTLDGLKKLVETLNKEKEFAIDLEVRRTRWSEGSGEL